MGTFWTIPFAYNGISHVSQENKVGSLGEWNFWQSHCSFQHYWVSEARLPLVSSSPAFNRTRKIHGVTMIQSFLVLYSTITNCMTHGPPGRDNRNCSCMQNAKCSRKFLFEFCNETLFLHQNGYLIYDRRDDGQQVAKWRFNNTIFYLDNIHVVPYSLCLVQKFNCHITI